MKLKTLAAAGMAAFALSGCAGWHPHGNWVPRVDTNAPGFNRAELDRAVVECDPEARAALEKSTNAAIPSMILFGAIGGAASGAAGGSVTGGIAGGMIGSDLTSKEMDRLGIKSPHGKTMAACLTRKGYRVTGPGVL